MVVPLGSHKYPMSSSLGWPVMWLFLTLCFLMAWGQIVPRGSTIKIRHCYSPEALVALPFPYCLTYQRTNSNPIHSVAAHHNIRVLGVSGLTGEIQSQGTVHSRQEGNTAITVPHLQFCHHQPECSSFKHQSTIDVCVASHLRSQIFALNLLFFNVFKTVC